MTAHRLQCGPLAWIEELADLRTTLEDGKRKSMWSSLAQLNFESSGLWFTLSRLLRKESVSNPSVSGHPLGLTLRTWFAGKTLIFGRGFLFGFRGVSPNTGGIRENHRSLG